MSYVDRRMMKWNGFVLSEHSEDVAYHNREKIKPIYLDEQSIEIFNEMLILSYQNQTLLRITTVDYQQQFTEEKISTGYVWKNDIIQKGVWLKDKDGNKGDFIPIRMITMIEEVDCDEF